MLVRLVLSSVLCVPLVGEAAGDDPLRPLDDLAREILALDVTAGMAIAVVHGERVVFAKGYGVTDVENPAPITPDTQFFIASTTKALTGLAVLMQEHRGRIDLASPVSRYLPALKLDPALDPGAIRLMDLLTMTHGISEDGPVVLRTAYTAEFTNPQLLELAAQHRPAETGRAFAYGNLGYNLIGLVLDPKREEGWKEIVDREVLAPLGMTNTTAYRSRAAAERLAMPHTLDDRGLRRVVHGKQDRNMHAAGGHISTVRDLARLLIAEINGGRVDGKALFPAAVIRRSQTQQVEQDRTVGPFKRHGWGVGWDLGRYEDDLLVHRPGNFLGFTSHASFMPEKRVGVVVLANAGGPAASAVGLVAAFAYDVVLGRRDLEPRRTGVIERVRELRERRVAAAAKRREAGRSGQDSELPKLVGAYANAGMGTMRVARRLSGLRVTMGIMESDAVWLDPAQLTFFTDLPSEEVLQFRMPPGAAAAKEILYLGRTFDRIGDAR